MSQFESTRKPNGAVSAKVVTGSQVSIPDYGQGDTGKDDTQPLPDDFPKVDRLTEAGYTTVQDLDEAADEELLKVDRIGEQSLEEIRAAIKELL